MPVRAPLNPAFEKWQEEERAKRTGALTIQSQLQQTGLEANRLGYIPEPYNYPTMTGPSTQIEKMVKAGLAAYAPKYDLRTEGFLTPIRNQSPFGTCWAFASLASMESNIKKTTGATISLSPWHLAWFAYNPITTGGMVWPSFTKSAVASGEDPTFDIGGNASMTIAIMSRGNGPVLEVSAPYQGIKNYPQSSLPKGTEARAATIKNAFQITTNSNPLTPSERDTIKGLVATYGAVAVSMYSIQNDSYYYNSRTYSFRYVQNTNPIETNHLVNIVGWDDDFPRSSFPLGNQPTADGAWIIRNSWGTSWGESGYFYLSYDTSIGWFTSFEATSDLDTKTYQYDLLGKVGVMGYRTSMAWFANIFTASGNDKITDIAFYTSVPNASYQITIRRGVTGNPNTGTQVFGPQTGTLELPGYNRIRLTTPVDVSNGERFAVIVRSTEPGNDGPVPLSWSINNYTDGATAVNGVGYFSSNGSSWTDANTAWNDTTNVSICLKAFAAPSSAPTPISVSVSPSYVEIPTGGTQTFTATVTGGSGNGVVAWSATGGTFSVNGNTAHYTAPDTVGTYTVTARSQEDTAKTATATVTAFRPIEAVSVSVSPSYVEMPTGGTHAFTATVTGGSGNTSVTWSASGGTFSVNGNTAQYTASSAPGTYIVTATSVEDASKSGTATINVFQQADGISVSVVPSSAQLLIGGAQLFTANVSGGSGNTNVTWGASGGDITPGGLYTAPNTPGMYMVIATSVEDTSKSGSATVTVIPIEINIVNPKAMFVGETEIFVANVSGPTDTSVTWEASIGSIDAQGHYTAPATVVGMYQTATITARSTANTYIIKQVSIRVNSDAMTAFDGNGQKSPQLLNLADAFGSNRKDYLELYDLNGDDQIDNEDIKMLFKRMKW
jgi:C1A family cysteine protease